MPTVTFESLEELLLSIIEDHPTIDSEDAGIRALQELGIDPMEQDAGSLLVPAVRMYAHHVRRQRARNREDVAFGSRAPRATISVSPEHDPRRNRTLMESKFWIPIPGKREGREVTWADATVEDHELRIAHLENQVRGFQITMARHQWAIDTINSRGVFRLGDIADLVIPDIP